jgi:Flp pilus assembly protein TadG
MTKRNLAAKRRGAILLLIGVSMVAFMGVLLFAVDAGIIQQEKRKAQAAADAAAQAGAHEILREKASYVVSAAQSEAANNGYTTNVAGHSVDIYYPNNTIGTMQGANYVGVLVRDTVTTLFGSIFGRRKVVINARAVGGVSGTSTNCLTVLDQTADQAFEVASQAIVRAVSCTIQVNSNNATAMQVTGSSLVADGISVTGNYFSHDAVIDANGSAAGNGSVAVGQPRAADPLFGVVFIQNVSDTLGCPGVANSTAANTLALNQYKLVIPNNGDVLNPGIYCGGIRVASDNAVRLNPGLYVIHGGGLYVGGGGSLIGNGPVNIVNLNRVGGPAKDFEGFSFASDAYVQLTAAVDRPGLVGILFFSPPGQGIFIEDNSVQSSGNSQINGSFYFPDQLLHVGSGGAKDPATLTINGGIVAQRVAFLADAKVDITGFAGANPNYSLKRASVVE